MMRLSEVAGMLPGAHPYGDTHATILRVHTDTRSLQPGDLFVALKGEQFDGNDYLAEAAAKGCAAVLAERGVADCGLPGLQVIDARTALGELAAAWRKRFSLPLIAVTGSNGKTTVTQMIASILAAWHGADSRLATLGNFNNDIGLPLTLLRLRAGHKAGVVELGMNHPGEIALLANIARPTVALVNNAQREHQEFMASVHAVALENGAVLKSLSADGVAVFPAGDEFTPLWKNLSTSASSLSFGFETGDVTCLTKEEKGAQRLSVTTPHGAFEVKLAISGVHNAKNALAAIACSQAAGAPIAAILQGLEQFRPVKGRLVTQLLTIRGSAVTLIDDTYNANPDSVRAAIDVLGASPGPRWLVLGDMGEVGNDGPSFHAEVGRYARERGVDTLFALGEQMLHAAKEFGSQTLYNIERLDFANMLRLQLAEHCPATVLVKGSRFMKMEEFVTVIAGFGEQVAS
jgi:UDP-N-acetylmuramoyl-tripeptide--D-alanyl-D-alanine ligase